MKNQPEETAVQAEPRIRDATDSDISSIAELYRAVGRAGGGLARTPEEITVAYVSDFVEAARHGGIELLAVASDGTIAGEIHTYPPGPATLAHVLGQLTVAVHPDWQGRGVGRALFRALLDRIEREFPHVLRVELKARETNSRAIGLYESLGFQKEGRMVNRIRLENGSLDADIPMAWHRAETPA
jgi:ribosomal protein S18 acetylase RimI-like enzyme